MAFVIKAIKIIISQTTDLKAVDVLAHFYTEFILIGLPCQPQSV